MNRVLCRVGCDTCSRYSYVSVSRTNRALANASDEVVTRVSSLRTAHSGYADEFSLSFGWLVPIAVLFVISFPPVRLQSLDLTIKS